MEYKQLIAGILVTGFLLAPVTPGKSSTDIGTAFAEESLTADSDPAKLRAKLSEIDKRILESPSAKLYAAKANVLAFLNLDSEAISSIDKAISLQPKNGKYHAYKGLLYSSLGRPKETITNIEKGRSLGYTDSDYLGILALAQTEMQDFNNALKNANTALELNKTCYAAWYARGRVHSFRKNYKNALTDFSQAISLASDLSGPYTERALLWEKLGNKKNSSVDRQKAQLLKMNRKK